MKRVRIDRPRATAEIGYEPGTLAIAELLQRLADAIRGTAAADAGAAAVTLIPQDLSRPKFTVHRHRGLLTTWEVTRDRPGLLSVRHDLMTASRRWPGAIAHQVESVHGVRSAAISTLTGTLKIDFDPAQTQARAAAPRASNRHRRPSGRSTPRGRRPPRSSSGSSTRPWPCRS